MNFMEAIDELRDGKKMKRAGWKSKHFRYLWLNTESMICASIKEGYSCPAFLSIADVLSDDWEEV